MTIISLFISFGLLIVAMTIHEFSHGWVAYKLGDSTAKHSGRLTLNPLAHIDPIGTVILPLFLFISTHGRFVFGAAKPVPINYNALRNPKRDIIWIGLAGPLSNIIFAFLLSLILRNVSQISILAAILTNLITINLVLGVFNLIPIPPLDGSRVLMGILPSELSWRYALIEPFGFFIVMILVFLGVFDLVIWPVIRIFINIFGIAY